MRQAEEATPDAVDADRFVADQARAGEARQAFDQAIALAATPAQAAHIRKHLDQLAGAGSLISPG